MTCLAYQHQHRVGHAALAGSAKGGAQHVVDCLAAIGVRHDHTVILGAHHRLHPFACRTCPLVDMGADGRRADEGERLDVRMVADVIGNVRPAVHHVEHPVGHAGLMGQFDQTHGGRWVLL